MSTKSVITSNIVVLLGASFLQSAEWPIVKNVERQPLAAQVKRIGTALDFVGSPLPAADRKALEATQDVLVIQKILDKHCLFGVEITKHGENGLAITTVSGTAKPLLAQQGWRVFLVKVANHAGIERVELRAISPNALPIHRRDNRPDPKVTSLGEVEKRFLDLDMYSRQPLLPDLSGLELEYRILQIFSRDAGRKEAKIGFGLFVPQKRQPGDRRQPTARMLAQSPQLSVLFESSPAVPVKFRVADFDGKPVMAAFTIRDKLNRVYPAMSRRLAPDFFFHQQIYRYDGESVLLQPGTYTVEYTRGPEYLVLQKEITVPDAPSHEERFQLKRWIHLAARKWYSGDHHIHAAGCAHYSSPTEGVTPEDMMRHVLGEDLNVGCCLSWGPCWYHQKRYFQGSVHPLSRQDYLLRYDVEVSGFPSSHCGHICLLRLKEDDYPGTKVIDDWPSWDLPILRWAKKQGGVVGFAHSGWGLEPIDAKNPAAQQLPNFLLPKMNSIGANEYLVDLAHGMCDFISTVDTPSVWELNIWYHTLNCGYRCRISGETDFPCIYGQRVGLGRSYVHLDGKLDFDRWTEGIKNGRCYVSDGKSHLIDFAVNGLGVGLKNSEVRLPKAGKVTVTADVAALLQPQPTPQTEAIRKAPLTAKPYWDIERARIGKTRKVPVEVVVNGYPVARQEIVADGKVRPVRFEVPIEQSSWVCLRIFPSSHTNPVFVLVGGKPVRANKKSAQWCLDAIEQCWKEKVQRIRAEERKEARAAYDKAIAEYKKILAESD
ncbi:MAG: hypothetical protein KatS3mg105_3255 [Gemmatales bacterium]|nr:MAG: hypothetical protein KatS3mg105_3255 [Gemmatales bacterium]